MTYSHQSEQVTAMCPTYRPPMTIAATIESCNHQSTGAKFIVVNTDPDQTRAQDDLALLQENHKIITFNFGGKRWAHQSAPVAAAIDAATDLCETEYLFLTHDDCWLNHNRLFAWMIELIQHHDTPVVGYEMSPRSWITDQWKGMVSHTCTMIHVPTIKKIKARWDIEACLKRTDLSRTTGGWPDTETGFGLALKGAGIKPFFIGHESNKPLYIDENITHRRSLTSHRIYQPATANIDNSWITAEMAKLWTRLGKGT